MDILSEIFDVLRPSGAVYFPADVTGGYAVEIPEDPRAVQFHLLLQGRGFGGLSHDKKLTAFEERDMLILPNGGAHILTDKPGRTPVLLPDLLEINPLGEDGVLQIRGEGTQRVRLLCGSCRFDDSLGHPILATLPDVIVLRRPTIGEDPWLSALINVMALEAERGGFGMTAIITRLLEALFIQVLRARFQSEEEGEQSYLRALTHPKIGAALQRIHASPENKWTLSLLAKDVGMSRSSFAQKFMALVGETPISYLTRWRLLRARNLLQETDWSMAEIADACGYKSVPSFTRRFSVAFGVGPGKFRRAA